MKKKALLILLVVFTFIVTGCEKNTVVKETNQFKEEYESLNGKTNSSNIEYRTVTISSNNPFVYATAEEIVEKIENGESFYVYFGDSKCPWCRSVIEQAIASANKYGIKTIYYVKIWDDDHNEILRDVYEIGEDNLPLAVSEGTEAYQKLLSYFNDVLSYYILTDNNGNGQAFEKRIFAPNYIYVKSGKATSLVSGISSLQENSNDELTAEIIADEKKTFDDFFSNAAVCDDKGC